MKVIPTSGPTIVADTGAQSAAAQSARARAIARIQGTPAELNAQPSQTPPTQYPANQRPQLTVGDLPVEDPSNPVVQEVTNETAPVAATEAVAADAVEPAVTPAPVEEAPQISSQYAQLARQTKVFRAQQAAAKAEQTAFRAEQAAFKAEQEKAKVDLQSQYVPKERITKETLKVLQEQGLTMEQITNMALNQPDPAEHRLMSIIEEQNAKIAALQAGQESTKKSFEDQQRQSYTQAVNMIRNETTQLVSSDPAFETIKATNSVEDVVELITKTFEKDGRMLTVQEAADAVEDYLVEEALKIAKLSKIQQRLKPTAAPAKAAAAPAPTGAPKTATKTLTSSMNNSRPLTAKERAILAFKGELKD